MATLTVFKVQNDQGQELLDHYIQPLCNRLGVRLREAPAHAERDKALVLQATSTLCLWDCSVEPGHVYNALHNWVKTTRKHVLVSRTPLPRNVLTHYQCAPIHGEQFSNAVLGEWLDRQLPALLRGTPSGAAYQNPALAHHYWMYERPAEYFLSFRGTHQAEAAGWKKRFEQAQGTTVRLVPENEYAYPTECVTQQQQWEGVARLRREMLATGRVLLFMSDDYFDSFWTSSELLAALWMKGRDRWTGKPMLDESYFVPDSRSTQLQSFRDGMQELAFPSVGSQAGMDRFAKLINNGDPITSAPEYQVPPSGPARLLALFSRKWTGHDDPEFMTRTFWQTIRVPCPVCQPRKRRPQEVDWNKHMALPDDTRQADYFGYFPAAPGELETGTVQCPHCQTKLRLENKRGVRTLWAPLMTTEKERTRPVIEEHKVWEVVPVSPEQGLRQPWAR